MINDEFPITVTNPSVPAYWVTKKKDFESKRAKHVLACHNQTWSQSRESRTNGA